MQYALIPLCMMVAFALFGINAVGSFLLLVHRAFCLESLEPRDGDQCCETEMQGAEHIYFPLVAWGVITSAHVRFRITAIRPAIRSGRKKRYALGQAGQPVVTAYVLTGYAVQRFRPQLLCACAAGLEIEDPFGTDANDLPLDKMRDAFVSDSKMMLEQASPPPHLLTCALYMRTLESITPLPQ